MSNQVIFNTKDIAGVNAEGILELQKISQSCSPKSARLCLHQDIQAKLHNMIIVHTKGVYVKPHKHPEKVETFHMIEGSMVVIIFDELGKVINQYTLREKGAGDFFILRIESNYYHTVIPLSETVIFHEITSGPFTGSNDSVFPAWAPEKDQPDAIAKFYESLGFSNH